MTQDEKLKLIRDHLGWGDASRNPFEDLNACHEMEKQATQEYASLLRLIVADAHHIKASDADCLSDNALVKATAAQRAEAFGLSLKLWTTYLTEPFCE